jgi:hypothetical protein
MGVIDCRELIIADNAIRGINLYDVTLFIYFSFFDFSIGNIKSHPALSHCEGPVDRCTAVNRKEKRR